MSRIYAFVLDNQVFPIDVDRQILIKLPDSIGNQLLQTGNYFVQSKVQKQNFQAFLDYFLGKNEGIPININNYYDFLFINDEFNNILSDFFSKQEFEQIKDQIILQNIITSTQNNKSFGEKYISENLDYFLDKYNDDMMKVPCNSLYNIFNHSRRVLHNQDRAYQFISKILANSNDLKICVILETIEASKISDESLKDAFAKREERLGFMPVMNYSFIASIKESISEMNRKLVGEQREQQRQAVAEEMRPLFEQMNSVLSCVQALAEKIKGIEEKIHAVSEKCDTLSSSSEVPSKIAELQTQVQRMAKAGNDIRNDVQQISRKSDDIQSCVQLHYNLEHDQFNGIIRKLTQECGGNVHDKGVIAVTASSEDSSSLCAKRAVDFDDIQTRFRSKNESNSWLCYDFKGRKVRPTHYSIRSKPYCPTDLHPKCWVIEGSNTGNEWKVINTRKNIDVLCNFSVSHTFAIQQKLDQNEYYRFLRIRQTGSNASGNNHFGFSALEYFGSMI